MGRKNLIAGSISPLHCSQIYMNKEGDISVIIIKALKFNILLLLFLGLAFISIGCGKSNPENLSIEDLREAVTNQSYEDAKSFSQILGKTKDHKDESEAILRYLDYEDNMLLAAFWEDDYNAVQYIAPIIHDIDRLDPRFEASTLVLAAAWGKTEIVLTLLEAGANPNYGADKDGLTALMWACKNFDEQLDMVRALLEAGADIYAKTNYNETPLTIAEEYMNPNIAALINEYSETQKEEKTE